MLQIPIACTVHRLRLFLATGVALLVPSTTVTAAVCVLYAILYTPQLLRRLVCTAVHVELLHSS